MKKIKEWFKTKQVQYILFAMAGLFLGWLFFSPSYSMPSISNRSVVVIDHYRSLYISFQPECSHVLLVHCSRHS